MVRTEGAYTERDYKGCVIRHLHGTLTYRVYDPCGELIGIVGTLKDAKRLVNLFTGT